MAKAPDSAWNGEMSAKVHRLKQPSLYEDVTGVPYLKRNRKSGIYYVRKFKAGRGELFQTTGERTRGRATRVADDLISAWLGGKRVDKAPTSIRELCEELAVVLVEQNRNGKRSAKTVENDHVNLPLIARLFGDMRPEELDEDFWEDWARTEGEALDRTLFDIAKYLSKVLTYAHRKKHITRKPAIKNPDADKKEPERRRRAYTTDELRAMCAVADPKTLAQLALGYECGLRPDEIRCMRRDWLDFKSPENATLDLPVGFVKANARTIQLAPHAALCVWAVIEKGPASPFVFPSPTEPERLPESKLYQNKRWRRVVRASKIRPANAWFRYLRHTFANTALLDLELPSLVVAQYMGTSEKMLRKHYLLPDPKRTASVAGAIQLPRGKQHGDS